MSLKSRELKTVKNLQSLTEFKREIMLADVTENMFLPKSDHLERRIQVGKSIDVKTIISYRSYIRKNILSSCLER